MYPEEGLKYIEERNHYLSTEENYYFQNNIVVDHKHYEPETNITEMWDKYGNHYWYTTYEIIEKKCLIKY